MFVECTIFMIFVFKVIIGKIDFQLQICLTVVRHSCHFSHHGFISNSMGYIVISQQSKIPEEFSKPMYLFKIFRWRHCQLHLPPETLDFQLNTCLQMGSKIDMVLSFYDNDITCHPYWPFISSNTTHLHIVTGKPFAPDCPQMKYWHILLW